MMRARPGNTGIRDRRRSSRPACRWSRLAGGAIGVVATLTGGPAFAHGISAADRQAMLDGGYLRYVSLGASHMVTGYDHLLFLLGVVFFLTSARQVIKFVSAFTLGHSITLVAATFAGVSANYFLVDAVIALSVCYKGFDNNDGFRKYLGFRPPELLPMVFVFGLIHGFGLSTRLQQLPLGDSRLEILGRIVAFNVGVELGQIAALLLMLLVLSSWRRRPSFLRFSALANGAIVVVGVLLFLMQMHGYLHVAYPDEFGFNEDGHAHSHEDMKSTEEDTPHDNL
jgi:hypothetical protein